MKKHLTNLFANSFVAFLLTFTLISTAINGANASVDPSIEWKVMKLPHFNLIYDAKHQELAELYAARLENNRSVLAQYFSLFPDKITVVLNDQTDLTNGYATPIPYDLMMLYPVLPGPAETIGEYGDWSRELTMHEYTHILSFQSNRSFIKALRYVFGSIINPNILLPRWWLEGIAVDMETRNSDFGRLRSTYQDGAIRSYLVSNSLKDVGIDEINETSIHTWPQGMRPYLFGSLLWNYMISKAKNKDLVKDLHYSYGGRVPYFINAPVIEMLGDDYYYLFEDMKIDLAKRASAQIESLKKVPTPTTTQVPLKGLESISPVISPDGTKMVYMSKDDANKRSIKILERPNLETPFDKSFESNTIRQKLHEDLKEQNPIPHDGPPGDTVQRLAWFPDSKRFVYDRLYERNRFHEVSDLYLYDTEKEKVEQLTFGLRAREAAVSPDSKKIVFVKLEAGQTSLGLYDLEKKSVEIIYNPGLQKRVSFPVFVSSDEVLFSLRDNQDQVWKINLATKNKEQIFTQYRDVKFLTNTAAGLIFVSNKNGVNNLYLSTNLKDARPLTNSLTSVGISSYDIGLKEFYVTELTSHGQQIFRLKDSNLPNELTSVQPLLADRFSKADTAVPALSTPPPENYSSLPYLLPRYWFPSFVATQDGTYFGIGTSSQDPLGKHAYSVQAGYDSGTERGNYSLLYSNSSFEPILSVMAFDLTTNLPYVDYKYINRQYDVQSLWQLPSLSTDLYAGVGWSWLSRDLPTRDADSNGPFIAINYFDATQSGAQISPESGQGLMLKVTDYLSQGTREDFNQYRLLAQKFFSKWLPTHHVLYAKIQGQYIDENVTLPNYESTLNYNLYPNLPNQFFVMRGFVDGQFLAKSLANYTLEYRFPIAYPYAGSGTNAFFLKKLHGAVVADGIQLDGFSYDVDREAYFAVPKWRSLWSAGAELKADLTLGYVIPLTFYVGYYLPLQKEFRNNPSQFALGIQL